VFYRKENGLGQQSFILPIYIYTIYYTISYIICQSLILPIYIIILNHISYVYKCLHLIERHIEKMDEVSFGKYKLGELDKVSFGILNTTVSISIWIFLPLEKRHLAYKIVKKLIKIQHYLLHQFKIWILFQ